MILLRCVVLNLMVCQVVANDPPPTPAPVNHIVWAVPFKLETPYRNFWRAEQPEVSSGYVVVLQVDPDLVKPRQTEEPVLYVGDQVAERVNCGHASGHVIAIVPGIPNNTGQSNDLHGALFWFGKPALPERIDGAEIAAQKQTARAANIRVFAAERIDTALQRGGTVWLLPNKTELMRSLVPLIQEYAPDEKDLIRQLRPKD